MEVKVPLSETLPHLNSRLNKTGAKGAGCFQGQRRQNKQTTMRRSKVRVFVALTENRKTFGQALAFFAFFFFSESHFSAPSFPPFD